jgi:hypothetical protein
MVGLGGNGVNGRAGGGDVLETKPYAVPAIAPKEINIAIAIHHLTLLLLKSNQLVFAVAIAIAPPPLLVAEGISSSSSTAVATAKGWSGSLSLLANCGSLSACTGEVTTSVSG